MWKFKSWSARGSVQNPCIMSRFFPPNHYVSKLHLKVYNRHHILAYKPFLIMVSQGYVHRYDVLYMRSINNADTSLTYTINIH